MPSITAAQTAQYRVQLRYEQHLTLFDQQQTTTANGQTTTTRTIAASRTLAFTLESQGISAARFPAQAEIAALVGNKAMAGDHPAWLKTEPLPSTPEEAAEMISEEGYWGVKKTAARLADFVIRGAGDDLERLRAGRAGILKGFQEAEAVWGATLPEISHQTLETALAAIDERIRSLDGSVVDVAA